LNQANIFIDFFIQLCSNNDGVKKSGYRKGIENENKLNIEIMRILIVEDEKRVSDLLKKSLEAEKLIYNFYSSFPPFCAKRWSQKAQACDLFREFVACLVACSLNSPTLSNSKKVWYSNSSSHPD